MKTVDTVAGLHAFLEEAREATRPPDADRGSGGSMDRRRLALVPTMGYLHEGHLSLVDRARARADVVVLSVFVNPLQFGPGEDLERYPRDLARDAELALSRGVDLLFAPGTEEFYPRGAPDIRVTAGPLADRLCGHYRPGHFDGVLTVVAKLFNVVRPDVAVFGQKDFQQAVLIRRMAEDLDFGIEIDVAPIVREEDGLAMSSRNTYLSPSERKSATALYRGLSKARDVFLTGERDGARLCGIVADMVGREPDARVQYVELVDPHSLDRLDVAVPGSVLAVAAFVGTTRLIDNIVLV
ncbi:MAG TPA: pantoate--beta-alanine ligase [Longimicrobiales bacterium]|nr:pantoate--beta-alanine ligase [Longimicrobiales bacterium]